MVTYPVQPWTNFIIVYIYVYVYEWKNLSESRPDCQLAGRTNNRQYMYMYIYIDVQMHYCECELCEDTCLYSSFNSLMENGMSISFSAVFVVVYALPVSLILTGSIDILGLCSSGSREAKSRLSMLSALISPFCRGGFKLGNVVVMSTSDERPFRPKRTSRSAIPRPLTCAASSFALLWHDPPFDFRLLFLLVWHLQGSPSSQRHRVSSSSLPTAGRRAEAHMHPPDGLKFLVLLSSLQWPHVVDGLPLRLIICSGPSVWVHCAALWPLIHVSQAYLTPLITTILWIHWLSVPFYQAAV